MAGWRYSFHSRGITGKQKKKMGTSGIELEHGNYSEKKRG